MTTNTDAVTGPNGWEANARYLLDRCPQAVRVREGGGPENLLLSLCVTFQKLQDAARAAPVAPPPVGEGVPDAQLPALMEKIDTLIACVNEAHLAKSDGWREGCWTASNLAREELNDMLRVVLAPVALAAGRNGKDPAARELQPVLSVTGEPQGQAAGQVGAMKRELLALVDHAKDIFDGPECSQTVRDAIEWYHSSIVVALDRAATPAPAQVAPTERDGMLAAIRAAGKQLMKTERGYVLVDALPPATALTQGGGHE